MKNRIFIISILIINSLLIHCQTYNSALYNSNGHLRVDSSLKISLAQLQKWSRMEGGLIDEIVHKVKYSQMASESDLKGLMIVSFEIDSSGKVTDFKSIKEIGGGLEEIVKTCLTNYMYIKTLASSESKVNLKYYLAIYYDLINANEYIRKNGAIPITKVIWEYSQ